MASIGSNIDFYVSGLNSFNCSFVNMNQRQANTQCHCVGKTNPQMVRLLKAAKSTVRDAVKRFKELETCSDRPRCGRPRTARTLSKLKSLEANKAEPHAKHEVNG